MKFAPLFLFLALGSAFAAGADSTMTARDAHRAKIAQAIQDRDYDAWKAERDAWGVGNGRNADKVTRENFATFAELQEARQAGDTDKAAELSKSLGFQYGSGQGLGRGNGQGRGNCTGMGNGSGRGKRQGRGGGAS